MWKSGGCLFFDPFFVCLYYHLSLLFFWVSLHKCGKGIVVSDGICLLFLGWFALIIMKCLLLEGGNVQL